MFWFPFWVRLLCGSGTGWSHEGSGAAVRMASGLLDLLLSLKVQEELYTCKCLSAPSWRYPLTCWLDHSQVRVHTQQSRHSSLVCCFLEQGMFHLVFPVADFQLGFCWYFPHSTFSHHDEASPHHLLPLSIGCQNEKMCLWNTEQNPLIM